MDREEAAREPQGVGKLLDLHLPLPLYFTRIHESLYAALSELSILPEIIPSLTVLRIS